MVGDWRTGGLALKLSGSSSWNIGRFDNSAVTSSSRAKLVEVININGNVGANSSMRELGVLGGAKRRRVDQQGVIDTVLTEFSDDATCAKWGKIYEKYVGRRAPRGAKRKVLLLRFVALLLVCSRSFFLTLFANNQSTGTSSRQTASSTSYG